MPRGHAAARSRAFGLGLRLLMNEPGRWSDGSGRIVVRRAPFDQAGWVVYVNGVLDSDRFPTLAALTRFRFRIGRGDCGSLYETPACGENIARIDSASESGGPNNVETSGNTAGLLGVDRLA